jgi:thiol-disulfide isomerase/thioredoxin
MKKLLIALVVFLSITCSAQEIKKIKITDLQKTIAASKTPLIINFWASYCSPCIKEIPFFEEIVAKNKSTGVRLLLVSLDLRDAYPAKIQAMSKKLNFSSAVVWLDETNADYFCPKVDTAWSGGIPSSLFINNQKGYRKFFETELTRVQFEAELKKMIQ